MWVELLTFVFGIAFGFFHPGKEDYYGLLRNGAITGIVLGIIVALISIFLIPGGLGIGVGFLGVFSFFIIIIIFVIIFIAGTLIGDWLERFMKK